MEWLETNGIGGFASSTASGMNTRRYHGLLTAATTPPAGRMALLSKLEETLVCGSGRYDLSTNQYAGAVHPEGDRYLVNFRVDPYPVWRYEAGGVTIVRRLFLVHGENTVCVEYEIDGADGACSLEVRPLVAFRDYHATTHANPDLNGALSIEDGVVSLEPYTGLPRLYIGHDADALDENGCWYYGFDYAREQERGLDHTEDLYNPFTLRFDGTRRTATIVVSTERHLASDVATLHLRELRRRAALTAEEASPAVQLLTRAADQFIVDRGDLKTIIAGYHWFCDWGRDAMIALPGLTLTTARPEPARNILRGFARYADQGMLPNRFPDTGEIPEYNTVDAALWFFEAARAYADCTGDLAFIRDQLYEPLSSMIDWHVRGTRYGICADSDGLLKAGNQGDQLTWMDVKIGDWVVTPRHGKPVEIEALWYNALRVFGDFAQLFHDDKAGRFAKEISTLAIASFNQKFFNEQTGCLYDVINGDDRDESIRPNQVLAASLHHQLLAPADARRMLAVVQRELLTPYGLRTLSPADPQYCPRYEGGVRERDSAYHQGTVWPWLMGPYITAYVKAHGGSPQARAQAAEWLEPLQHYAATSGGQIPEIFDGDAPHHARGCIAQAWSVAELLRCIVEDVLQNQNVHAVAAA